MYRGLTQGSICDPDPSADRTYGGQAWVGD